MTQNLDIYANLRNPPRRIYKYLNFDGWLTVHRSITLIDFQLDAQNSYLFIYLLTYNKCIIYK